MTTRHSGPFDQSSAFLFPEEETMDQLVRKNSIQAAQLTSMEKALRDSTEYIGICEDRVRKLESVRKLQSYDADAAFHRSLTNATPNTKNEDDMMVRLKDAEESLVKERFRITEMEKEMRSRERQHKLSETNAIELRSELQKTKALLQSTQHAARLTPKSSGAANSHAKLVAGLKSEICSLRAYLNSYQMRLESSKKTQRALVIRVGALEDQLDNMPPSIKYTDLELKVLTLSEKLRNENSKLHKDSPNPVAEISQDDGRRSDSEYDFAGPFFSDDSYRKEVSMMSCHDSHVEKEHQITSNSTLGLTRIESETGEKREKPFPDADATKLKNVMKERDVLLEFIQGDMMKSSEVNNELRKEKKKAKELGAAFNEERHRFNAMIAANGTALDESKLSFGTRTCVTDSIISEGNVCSDGDNATERTHINAAQMGKLDSNLRKGPQGSVVKRKAWVGTDGLDSLQVDTNWQAERAALLEELQRLRSLGSAVAEMVHDFKSMQQSAVSEERVPSLEGSLRDGIPQDSPPSIRSRVSTSRGPDPATLSYCDMYALRVARKKKPPSPLIDNPVLRSGTVNTTKVASEISSSVPTPHTSKVGHRSCLSQRHALWIALPSISRVSATLYKKLRGLYNDLTDAEAACSLLEDNLFSALEELEIVRRREDDYERKELLVAEPASAALLEAMHQTAAAVCSVPGGWEQFFDSNVLEYLSSSERHFKGFTEPDYKGISPSGNDSHARSSEPLSRRSAVDVRDIRLDTSHFDTRPLSSSTSLWGSVDDVSQTSIGTIRPLSVTNLTHTVGADDGKRKETLFGIDQRTDLHHHEATEPQRQHTHTLPLHLIPIVVSRAISMMRAFSTEVIDKQQQLSTALSDLQEARARTIVALEYTDCLTTELAMSEQREASRAEAFICIESNFREDIERLNTVSHDQQLFISRLAAEVDLLQRREIDFVTRQVTRTKEQRCSVLRDFGHQAEQGSMSLKPTTSSPMALLPLTPHGVRETSALQPFRVQGVGHGERNVPSNPDYFSSHGDRCTPNTPQQADPGEQLGGTPEEEEKAEGPRWNDDDDSVCGTPETDDSDLYCSDEEEEGIRFTADTHKEKVEVACDEDSEYSIERVFVNRYLSNSVTHTDHVSPSPVKVATSEARSREEVTCDVGIVGGSRNRNTQSNLCSSSTASHTYTKSNGTRDQYTNHCPDSVVCLSGRALRMDDPVLQLDNQLRKARLTFASLRAEIKTNL